MYRTVVAYERNCTLGGMWPRTYSAPDLSCIIGYIIIYWHEGEGIEKSPFTKSLRNLTGFMVPSLSGKNTGIS